MKSWFIQQVRELLAGLGLPQNEYVGHSFCIGATTSAAMAGIEDSMIQALGCWQSSTFPQYIRMSREHLALLTQHIAATIPSGSPTPTLESPHPSHLIFVIVPVAHYIHILLACQCLTVVYGVLDIYMYMYLFPCPMLLSGLLYVFLGYKVHKPWAGAMPPPTSPLGGGAWPPKKQ